MHFYMGDEVNTDLVFLNKKIVGWLSNVLDKNKK